MDVETLITAAKDDPIIPSNDIRRLKDCGSISLDIQKDGAHCAFIRGFASFSWADLRARKFINQQLAES